MNNYPAGVDDSDFKADEPVMGFCGGCGWTIADADLTTCDSCHGTFCGICMKSESEGSGMDFKGKGNYCGGCIDKVPNWAMRIITSMEVEINALLNRESDLEKIIRNLTRSE